MNETLFSFYATRSALYSYARITNSCSFFKSDCGIPFHSHNSCHHHISISSLFHNASPPSIYTPFAPPFELNLPLRLLCLQKRLHNRNHLSQRLQPNLEFLLHFRRIFPQLHIEILSVRDGAHRGAEDRFHHEGVVRFERRAIGGAEGDGELFGATWGGEVLG